MPGLKVENEYAGLPGWDLYVAAPKAVWAALAVSYVSRDFGGELPEPEIRAALLKEWETLHAARIVPQRPPRKLTSEVD